MTNDNLFIAILHMTTLSISLATPRAPLVSSNNFNITRLADKGRSQSARSKENFVKKAIK